MLQNESGTKFFSEGAKGNLAVDYYKELFLSTNPHDLETLFADFESRITPEMNVTLMSPVTVEEIKNAAFSISGDSAPGEDGFT